MIETMDLKQQDQLRNEILCKFIKNHKKCGSNCEHAEEFYRSQGIYDKYLPKDIPNGLFNILDE